MKYLNLLINNDLNPIFLFFILFLFSLLKSTIIVSSLLPPASITLIFGISASISKLNISLICISITFGSTTGSIICHIFGKNFIKMNKLLFKKKKTSIKTIKKITKKLKENKIKFLFISKFIAILRYITPLIAGTLFPLKKKLFITYLFSSCIWSIMYIIIVKFSLIKILKL
ncbi:hypothetical protein AOQ88_02275 [Candidatus Riesia sp. GBBU]|nr:hypothetical protein AOQ88_02175 [Candidatus Riesia sp. GBBU]ARC55047.1 hypothetical protein AOQ88_02275 [Candidatus Riesia sp. GBBU]